MSKFDEFPIDKLLGRLRKEAEGMRDDAGFGGRMDDGGCQVLLSKIDFFKAGIAFAEDGKLPAEWQPVAQEILNEADPEYATYMRLKKKFEAS